MQVEDFDVEGHVLAKPGMQPKLAEGDPVAGVGLQHAVHYVFGLRRKGWRHHVVGLF